MSEYGKPTKGDKIIPIVCLVIILAFSACVPAMYRDKQKREAQLWQDLGCHKYDYMKQTDVPAMCANTFVDHYAPQEQRVQPPDER